MRLVIATPLYPPDPGGPATYARLLEMGLGSYGIEVVLVKFGDVRKYPKLVRHVAYFWRVWQVTRAHDVVLALDPVSVGLPAVWAARLRRAAFLVKIVGDYAWEQGVQRFGVIDPLDHFVRCGRVPFPVAVLRSIQTHVAKSAERVIVPSEYLQGIIAAWGIRPDKIEVIYNAIELEEGENLPEAVKSADAPRVVSVGRLVPWKRVDGVIDAVTLLPSSMQPSVIVVGDGPERARLETEAKQKLDGRAVFTGAIAHADALAIMRAADVFVLNSTYEGLSHVLIEALMVGNPVIATSAGGNGELIKNDENGLLIPVNDTKALAQALERVLTDAALRERLSEHAVEARERFSVERMLSRTADFLMSL